MAFMHKWSPLLISFSSSSTFSSVCMLSRYAACQKYIQEPRISEKPNKGSYAMKQKEVTKAFNKKATKFKSRDQKIFRPPWLKEIHEQLMKSVILPQERQGVTELWNKSPQCLNNSDLISLASTIKSVDKETMKVIAALWRRLDSMTIEEILTAADVFFLSDIQAHWYSSAVITYISEMFEDLSFTPLQLTRLAFLIHQHGSAPQSLLSDIEQRICENLHDFSIHQVAMVCHLYFTGKNRIKSPILMDKISKKLLKNLDSFHKPHLAMLMKTFRFSNFIKVSFYKELGDKLVQTEFFKDIQTQSQLMHIALAYASVRITHPELFHMILTHIHRTHQYRLKDVAKVVWACGTLVTNQEEDISRIHDILQKMKQNSTFKQIKDYPDSMMDLLVGLAFLNIYPHNLINMVFDPAVLQTLLGLTPEREKFYQLIFLDHSVSIESPNYSGFRLTEADRKTVNKHMANKSLEVDVEFRRSVKPTVATLETVLGSDCVHCSFLLPHFQTSDILLSYDTEKKQFVPPVPRPLRPLSDDELRCKKRIHDVVLLLLSRAQTSYDGQPLGLLNSKIRQLQSLGYLVIQIKAEEAMSYTFQDTDKTQKLLLGNLSAALGEDLGKYMHV